MRKPISALAVTLVLALAAFPVPVAAGGPTSVNGGGIAVGPDSASQFGMDVNLASDGSVSGDFNCVMAGRSAKPGLSDMTVRGRVTSGSITSGAVTFAGVGTLNMNSSQTSKPEIMTVTFSVTVTAGGRGVGTLALDVPAASFGMSEVVASGQISIH